MASSATILMPNAVPFDGLSSSISMERSWNLGALTCITVRQKANVIAVWSIVKAVTHPRRLMCLLWRISWSSSSGWWSWTRADSKSVLAWICWSFSAILWGLERKTNKGVRCFPVLRIAEWGDDFEIRRLRMVIYIRWNVTDDWCEITRFYWKITIAFIGFS